MWTCVCHFSFRTRVYACECVGFFGVCVCVRVCAFFLMCLCVYVCVCRCVGVWVYFIFYFWYVCMSLHVLVTAYVCERVSSLYFSIIPHTHRRRKCPP